MAAMWKGHIKAGTVFNSPVTTLDFIPTFLMAAGAKPESYQQLQGKDLVEQMNAAKKNSSDRPLYWYVAKNKGAIRLGDYKMVFLPGKQPELYDLANDISEAQNLYESKPEVAQRLNALYKEWESKLPPPIWIAEGKAKPGAEG
jgi:arylsulfatase A-like enzyme